MAEGRTSNIKGIENPAFKDPVKMKGIQNPAFEDPYSSDRLTAIISPMRRPLATHNSHPDMSTPGFHRMGRESRRERRVSKEGIRISVYLYFLDNYSVILVMFCHGGEDH